MKNLSGLLKQAQQMQEKMGQMQEELASAEIEGTSGGGLVSIVLNGKGDLVRVKVDPSLADPEEVEILEDLLVAAHKEARAEVERYSQEKMKEITGGLDLPPGMSMPF